MFYDSHHSIYCCSDDVVHNGDVNCVVTELAALYSNVIQALPQSAVPNVFLKAGDLESAQPAVVDKLKDVTIVADNRKVTIPAQWLSILPGEQVICAHGEMFQMRCLEWIQCLCSLGIYYCTTIRREKFLRFAVVLTTKRIIVLNIHHRSGRYVSIRYSALFNTMCLYDSLICLSL